jgi:hypothetical protein
MITTNKAAASVALPTLEAAEYINIILSSKLPWPNDDDDVYIKKLQREGVTKFNPTLKCIRESIYK